MRSSQAVVKNKSEIEVFKRGLSKSAGKPLVLAFGSTETCEGVLAAELADTMADLDLLICSTSGHFNDQHITDEGFCLTSLEFSRTKFKAAVSKIENALQSQSIGEKLARELASPDLKQVLVFSDGLLVNGTALANGLTSVLGEKTVISGGLAGDGSRFKTTLVGWNGKPLSGQVAVIGFYGQSLETAAASMGGWDAFGPKRLITKSSANVLWELDGKPALGVYKEYLGRHAAELPASALLFPLSVGIKDANHTVVRTILSVDDATGAMTFAGDLPQGSEVQLMKSNIDRLVSGAEGAAQKCQLSGPAEFALLVSCVGRRLVMGQRTEEEIEAVQRATESPQCVVTGFYSYGELSPQGKFQKCDLHNQTMTVTLFRENL
ncbi:MAG: hypothetical protein RL189_464 [Pseudomonadota bacterium]